MKNLIVDKVVRVTAAFDTEQWGVSDDQVVVILNKTLEFCVNNNFPRHETWDRIKRISIDVSDDFLKEVLSIIYRAKE
jgi:hypothetical protein